MSATTNQPNQSRILQSTALSTLISLVVHNHFECVICLDTASFGGPNVIPECLHCFCDTCIKKSIQRCGVECPTCRARIASRRDLRKDQLVEDIVSEKKCVDCSCLTVSSSAVVYYLRIILLYSCADTAFSSIRWTKFTTQSTYWNALTFCK